MDVKRLGRWLLWGALSLVLVSCKTGNDASSEAKAGKAQAAAAARKGGEAKSRVETKAPAKAPAKPEAEAKAANAAAAKGAEAGAAAKLTPPKGARVFWVQPKDGATVPPKFHAVFGASGVEVVPAGKFIDDPSKGHHHVIVDAGPIPRGQAIPKDATHIHFGGGQKETDLTLPPGKHTLTLQFANGAHVSFGPALSATIHVTVQPPQGKGAAK